MQVYLVGGAVRDALLGLAVRERDWVVVGATPEQMRQAGYRAVGRDFPVFLHPQTQEEYALARLERKVGPGYRGFDTRFAPTVTLEEDLRRRDLTINAMARDASGVLIDPWGGQRDLQARLLRHVSPAFSEDPVRLLRVARFAARLAPLGFSVAPETEALMRQIVDSGEARELVPERVWRELERALGEAAPEQFIAVLRACGALAVVLPEIAALFSAPGTDGAATLRALHEATALGTDASQRYAVLLGRVPPAGAQALSERLRVPREPQELAQMLSRLYPQLADAAQLPAEALMELLGAADALRRPERFLRLLPCAQAWAVGAGTAWPGTERLGTALRIAAQVQLDPAEQARLAGPAIAAALRARRIQALARMLEDDLR